MRRLTLACLAAMSGLAACAAADDAAAEPAPTLVFHGSQSGWPTLDAGAGGGNPFASAFIETLADTDLDLASFPAALRALTAEKSGGFQDVDAPQPGAARDWTPAVQDDGETRIALVAVISDYSGSDQAASLPGAAYDADRVSRALTRAGFATRLVLDPDRATLEAELDGFAARSQAADAALIYTTGHGVEVDGEIRLMLGDVQIGAGRDAFALHGLPLDRIAAAPRARAVNLVLYAGCRDNPFGW